MNQIITSEDAANETKKLQLEANAKWKLWQILKAELKEAQAEHYKDAEGTQKEREAVATLNTKAETRKDIQAEFDYRNAQAEAETMDKIFLIKHAESKQKVMMDKYGN